MTPFWIGFLRGFDMGTWPKAHLWIYTATAATCAAILAHKWYAVAILGAHVAFPAWVLYTRLRR